MRGRWARAASVLAALMITAAPVAADDFTGHEEDEQQLACPGAGQSVPKNQEPPGPGECDEATETHYQGKVWDNNVTCAAGGTGTPVGPKVYTSGDASQMAGGVGVCNDGGSVPVQGRVAASGSQSQGGITIYADGDKDNSNESAKGFARMDAGTGGVTVRCGEDGGKMDATHPGPGDTQANCG